MNQEKYIGMDVHQATISVAVMDSNGKLIMECILETKADTILEFVHGVRGTVSVTFEEGTAAAWLHDLLKPHVAQLVVCDPRKNALLKDGSKSDRIDARKLAELLRGNQLHSVYHGRARGAHFEGVGSQLSDADERCHASHESDQSAVPQLGHSLQRNHGLCLAASRGVVGEDPATRSSSAGGTVVSATGSTATGAAGGATRPAARESQTRCREKAAADSRDRSDSSRLAGSPAANTAPFSYQAPTVGLQRFCDRDARQRRVSLCPRKDTTQPGAHHGARSER